MRGTNYGFVMYISLSKGMAYAQSEQAVRSVDNFSRFAAALSQCVGIALLAIGSVRHPTFRNCFIARHTLKDVGLGIAAGAVTLAFALLVDSPLGGDRWRPMSYHPIDEYSPNYISRLAARFFCDSIVLPFIETIIFSCFLYTVSRQKWHMVPSVMIVSALFAVVHQNLAESLFLFFFGVLNCLLIEWRKTPVSAVIHHVSFSSVLSGVALIS